ncbi:MAG TPA: MFS transporter [Deltaproteobacteria bacterium]|nr:MFS transporter [Deltaproteobacteria bacterium]HRW79526.1 MFS transporter [Desulfomonilia bacterium]NMD40598.1 MFS transporter [Deltaproteobacteria bacterium]HNQ84555.1 MFS transporter [Deltaproteobacteria bacterium]HNS88966.1 MFS transporter [Deltaproteobacteria bacterium]
MLAWAFYDWGNSAFATTVMAGFFPVMFKEYWSAGVDASISTARLGFANSLAGILVALAAPLLGAVADRTSAKKRFLFAFAAMGIASTVCLPMAGHGQWGLAGLLYALALAGFLGGNVFYDSLLKTVSEGPSMDRVSSLGYAMGYLGGGLLFSVNVWMTLSPGTFGLGGAVDAVRFSFFTVGIWWALFSLPLLTLVHEPRAVSMGLGRMAAEGMAQLWGTFREIRHLKVIMVFLLAYWLYIDGVGTIIVMAVDYGLSLGFEQKDLILALLMVQFTGFPCAIGFGRLAGYTGTKPAILIALGVYLFVTLWGAFIESRHEFYIMALLIGMVQGGVQALSRSLYARIIPADKAAEFFGFYNVIGKFATIMGPVLVAATVLVARAWGAGPDLAPRISISSIAVLFLAGGALLLFVDEKKGLSERIFLEH